jgi:acetyl esterase/lipase
MPRSAARPANLHRARPALLMASWKVAKRGPPTILFYGTEDPLQGGGRDFTRQLITARTRAEFYTAAGQPHGFFNRFPNSPWHALVLRQIYVFLAHSVI